MEEIRKEFWGIRILKIGDSQSYWHFLARWFYKHCNTTFEPGTFVLTYFSLKTTEHWSTSADRRNRSSRFVEKRV